MSIHGGVRRHRRRSWTIGVVATVIALFVLTPLPASAAEPTNLGLSWGQNYAGQLGDSSVPDDGTRTAPGSIDLPDGVRLTQVAAGSIHSLGLTSDGRVLAWGSNGQGEQGNGGTSEEPDNTPDWVKLPGGVTATKVAAGDLLSMALTSDGRVFTWGWNNVGQLGTGSTDGNSLLPVQVDLPAGFDAVDAAIGINHGVALAADGRVYSWGSNNHGQLGDGGTGNSSTPVETRIPAGATVDHVVAGGQASMAIADGGILTWGSGGTAGDGTSDDHNTPVNATLPGDVTIVQASVGSVLAGAVTSDGRLFAWGTGMIGDGSNGNSTPQEIPMPEAGPVVQVAADWYMMHAVTADGAAYGWGSGYGGRVGDDTRETRSTPTRVVVPDGVRITQIDNNTTHVLALAEPTESTTDLTADPTEAAQGDAVTLTSTVTCTVGTPTGTVTFRNGDAEIGTAELDANGVATLTTSDLPVGKNRITARYSGGGFCPASESDVVTVTITGEPGGGGTGGGGAGAAILPVTGNPVGTLVGSAVTLLLLAAAAAWWVRRDRPAGR